MMPDEQLYFFAISNWFKVTARNLNFQIRNL